MRCLSPCTFLKSTKKLTIQVIRKLLKTLEKPLEAPKRPVAAYTLFCSKRTPALHKEMADLTPRDRFLKASRQVSKEWKEMSEAEKEVYFFVT